VINIKWFVVYNRLNFVLKLRRITTADNKIGNLGIGSALLHVDNLTIIARRAGVCPALTHHMIDNENDTKRDRAAMASAEDEPLYCWLS
jgi:hypothetical protein